MYNYLLDGMMQFQHYSISVYCRILFSVQFVQVVNVILLRSTDILTPFKDFLQYVQYFNPHQPDVRYYCNTNPMAKHLLILPWSL